MIYSYCLRLKTIDVQIGILYKKREHTGLHKNGKLYNTIVIRWMSKSQNPLIIGVQAILGGARLPPSTVVVPVVVVVVVLVLVVVVSNNNKNS